MKTLFHKLLLSFTLIMAVTIISILVSFYVVYSNSYEQQIFDENSRQSQSISRSLFDFMNIAYKVVEEISFNNDVISMETERQAAVLVSAVKHNDYLELLFAQGMDGNQTGRSSGNLGYRGDRAWFIKMTGLRQPFISEAYYSLSGNMPITSVFYPITQDSQMIGIMGGDIKLSSLHDLVQEFSGEGNLAFILDGHGVVVAHPDITYQEQSYNYAKQTRTITVQNANGTSTQQEQSFTISDAYKAAITRMMNGSTGSAKFKEDGKMVYLSYRPVTMPGTSDPWYVLSLKDEKTAMQTRNTVLFAIIMCSCIVILLALVLVFFIARNISSPVKAVHLVLEKIQDGDLRGKTIVTSQDEIGEMAQMLNQSTEKIGGMIKTIKGQANVLDDIGINLSDRMNETTSAINQIASNIQTIKDQVISQSASVTESNATLEKISDNIGTLNTLVETQSSDVSKSSSAIEEMFASISSVTEILVKNSESVEELLVSSDVGRTGLQEVSSDIQEIARESEGLLEINAVMENIASQTSLLSMNAAIEAAHAGESGKGFAVVADEIRKLADNSAEQSKMISTVLKKIKSSIEKITSSTGAVLSKFEVIDAGIKTVSDYAENIRNAMEEQQVGGKQILEVIGELNEITQKVKNGSEEMFVGSKEAREEGKHLEIVSQEISTRMNEMASGTDQINAAVNQVNEMSLKNKDAIELLVQEVGNFKVE